jgi:hypothetical protein
MPARRFPSIFLIFLAIMTAPRCLSERDVRYRCPDDGFSISFPKAWKVSENVKDTRLLAEIPDERGAAIIRQNMNVVVETVQRPLGLQQFMDVQIAGMLKMKGLSLRGRGATTIAGAQAGWFRYRCAIHDFGYEALVYALYKGMKFYVITGISQCENFSRYEPIFKKAAESFMFEETPHPPAPLRRGSAQASPIKN